jgi:dipeptidyl aminopeptidase/acylaminoacyl peptidase
VAGFSTRFLLLSGIVGLAVIGVAVGFATVGSRAASEAPRFSGEFAVVVQSRGKQVVALVSADAMRARVVSRISVAGGIRAITWKPGARRLAVSTSGGNLSNTLRVIDLRRGVQRTLASAKRGDPAAFFGALAWSPDGRRIAVTRSRDLYGAEIDVLDAAKGSLLRSFRVGARFDSALSWSRDSASLYFAEQRTARARPRLRRLIVATGRVVPVGGVRGLDPSTRSDGALAFTADDGIRIFQNGRQRKVPRSMRGDRFATWSRDGRTLLAERSAAGCPRYVNPTLCSHVVLLTPNGMAVRSLLHTPARNPALR